MHLNVKKAVSKLSKYFGPSTLVAAAFIGPGTITTCTLAGVHAGYDLLWAMVFSIFATLVLQEMAARLGWVTRQGLGEAINKRYNSGISRYLVFFIVLGAIVVGNAAYESGNLSGGILGLELLFGPLQYYPLVIGLMAFVLLFLGSYKFLETVLVSLVILMSLCFLITAILVKPNIVDIISGIIPNARNFDLMLILGLIGTTVVPYNLFLHASIVSKKWPADAMLSDIRMENRVSIILGGLISMLVIIVAAANRGQLSEVSSAGDLALQLKPLCGSMAPILMGIGLLAAGLSSALTAPLSAAWAAKGLFGWEDNEKGMRFRLVWMCILAIGIVVTLSGLKPIIIIKFAQVTNAVLLPFIAGYLLYLANQKEIMGRFINSMTKNIIGGSVILITLSLSLRSLGKIFNLF